MHGWAGVRTDVHDVMAIKPNFLASMGYHSFLTMVLRARVFGARGPPLLCLPNNKINDEMVYEMNQK